MATHSKAVAPLLSVDNTQQDGDGVTAGGQGRSYPCMAGPVRGKIRYKIPVDFPIFPPNIHPRLGNQRVQSMAAMLEIYKVVTRSTYDPCGAYRR